MNAAVQMGRARRLAMGGTFLVAFALAVQLAQPAAAAVDQLLMTLPVAILGTMLTGWVLRPSAAMAMTAAITAALATFGITQSGSAYTDEMLLFAIPFSAAAAIVVGHCRDWKGSTAIAMSVIGVALAIGIGMTETPVPYIIGHIAFIVALPTIPVR